MATTSEVNDCFLGVKNIDLRPEKTCLVHSGLVGNPVAESMYAELMLSLRRIYYQQIG
jgi:hypothetical protein